MTSNPIFTGAATALITPTTPDGVDYEALGRLIDWQIAEGIDALVICGTSGEAPTLTDEEHMECIRYSVERAAGRVPIIAGTGSNYTDHAIEMTKYSCSVGADACLVVTPYYNKATQKGLVRHYHAIAEASTKPIIVYNVPSRTGSSIEPNTYVEMAEHPRIAAIKEANGDISKIVRTAALVGDKLDIYSGNDDQIVPILSMGGAGVISVLSNLMPRATSELCRKYFEGDTAGAAADQCRYIDLISALFCEVNPIPVKAAMAKMGFCQNYLRLPLTEMEPAHAEKLYALMAEQGLI
ncbi:MAG: 4-hydroxy-tetrahydrodipicolinate synthase [Oscillospiraceae bacterium]|nr:4-hydroxy-tetrahydrodipicolinate synthase [Oscillospiraceae bacterium]MCD8099068.1 4-hydroxy-tetrahydrodipicolinate synthase [Oscillospiraceae bacterium]